MSNRDFPIFIDGGMGTVLQSKAPDLTGPSEIATLEKSDIIIEIHKEYLKSGSRIITSNTFGASRMKLESFGLEDKIKIVNSQAINLIKTAIESLDIKDALVAGDIGPTGKMLYPLGDMTFDQAVANYEEQATILDQSGIDLFIVETFTDLLEIKAAICGIRNVSNKPVFASMSYTSGQRTLTGNTAESVFTTLQAMDIDAIGINCGFGPKELLPILKKALKWAYKPVFFQANAGIPKRVGNKTIFHESPSSFAAAMKLIAETGIEIMGGCCGTTPDHIREMIKSIPDNTVNYESCRLIKNDFSKKLARSLAGMDKISLYGKDAPFLVIGEKINPTGKKKLSAELKKGITSRARNLAISQTDALAGVLDVNVSVPGIDEKELMHEVITDISQSSISGLPVCIDSKDTDILEHALKICRGKPLVNSFSGDQDQIEKGLALSKKYGAVVMFLTLDKKGIPETAEKRLKIAEKVFATAEKMDVPQEHIVIDPLVMTISTSKTAALVTLKTLRSIKKKWPNANTTMGVSNISFGNPRRDIINSVFLAMAINNGLDMGIVNPLDIEIMNSVAAANMLSDRYDDQDRFIEYLDSRGIRKKKKKNSSISGIEKDSIKTHFAPDTVLNGFELDLWNSIIHGDQSYAKEILNNNEYNAKDMVDRIIIPAIEKTGTLYAEKIIYLNSMVKSAQAVKTAMAILEPLLKSDSDLSPNSKVLFATVQDDVHDIGKNIVALFLKNNGFDVIDLGKSVPIDTILEKIDQEKPDFIALSALMTTTMAHMETIAKELKKRKNTIPILIGGACVDKDFAQNIGAHYAEDAPDAIRLLKQLQNDL